MAVGREDSFSKLRTKSLVVFCCTGNESLYFARVCFSELESEVEMVRLDVVQKRCIGNPAEVDSLNSQLSIISRQVSDLKSKSSRSFPVYS